MGHRLSGGRRPVDRPLSVPALTSYGLTLGAFLSTEAARSLALMISKVATFRELGAARAGAFLGKAIVQRMSVKAFHAALDILLLCSGLSILADAFR